MQTVDMKMLNKIHASGALKQFLDARATGASKEALAELGERAMAEQEAERRSRPADLRLRIETPERGVVIKLDPARSLKKGN